MFIKVLLKVLCILIFFYIIISTLLLISEANIVPFKFFITQLRTSIVQFLLHSSIISLLLDTCYQKSKQLVMYYLRKQKTVVGMIFSFSLYVLQQPLITQGQMILQRAKLSVGYLVKEWELQENLTRSPRCICPLFIYMAPGPCYNNIYLALKSMSLPHVLLLIHMCLP